MKSDTARKAIRRSILKQEGVKRVEVILDPQTLQKLRDIMAATGATQSDCIVSAIESDHADCFGGDNQPLTRQAL